MSDVRTICFQKALGAEKVDRVSGVIRGVSLITSGVEAVGHDLHVDDKTIVQMLQAGKKKGQVPVKLNHGSGVENVCGYVDNFRIDGKHLRGDWHLLKSHTEYETTLERAEVMPGCFGLSAAFKGADEAKGGKKFARCEDLLAVDCVAQPAANPSGLFEARTVDKASGGKMADTNTTGNESLADVLAGLKTLTDSIAVLTGRIDTIEQAQGDFHALLNEPTLEDLAAMSDEELDNGGWDVDAVRAAVAEAGLGDGTQGTVGADGTNGGGVATGAPGGATAGAGAAVAALGAKVDAFIKRFEAKEAAQVAAIEQQEVEFAFQVVEEKVEALTKELAAKNAELQAVKANRRTGTQPVGAGVHLFDANPNDEKTTDFEKLVTAKRTELESKGMKGTSAMAQAVQFCIRNHRQAYVEFRNSGRNVVTLGS